MFILILQKLYKIHPNKLLISYRYIDIIKNTLQKINILLKSLDKTKTLQV